MSPQRKNGMRGLAHVIALKLYELSEPYLARGDDPPTEFLTRTFETACATANIRGGPLNAAETTLLARVLIPKALVGIRRNIERADANLMASMEVVNNLMAAA